ncbi:response regulator transcription factor [Larsenimonas suaedae]|uniref:Response regulator transcription factor n=1 Tax=Larsenimonas suaedae TaxID=1851019 RepID=A0ABU1GXW1_9GAMM|nr:response regulator transcription factor [Larsenimonas suaedae]MCM2973384.1 response regulator transcription factor [Larsenimonas suaedae]MDR5896277.1 response regulator transcription factor [Larsenimonas suaedae]
MKILLVEDDELLAESLAERLGEEGYSVDLASDCQSADALADTEQYAAVLLDLGLPDGSGLSMLKRWRAADGRVPVLALTARDSWEDKVKGLQGGADDYVTKPFHEPELLARLQALIRRASGQASARLVVADLELDEALKRLRVAGGDWQTLTATEYRLLRFLMHYPDRVHSKTQLLDQLYALDQDVSSPNMIEVYVARLRGRVGRARIETRRGVGYVLHSNLA